MMYLAAFSMTYALAVYRSKSEDFPYDNNFIQDFLVWSAFGLLIGARLGYALIYNPSYYLAHPLEIIIPFSFSGGFHFTGISGMSFHGGGVGVFIASYWFLRRNKVKYIDFADFFVPCIPLGYTFGRLGNFINGELYGRVTTVPWGMHFPSDPSGSLRHPSQLYEGFTEGVVLFIILWSIRKRPALKGMMFPMFLGGYALARFSVEYFRQPDSHIGFLAFNLSMGQILSLLMLAIAVAAGFFIKKVSMDSSTS
jgi:phosphatidylglycerol:prolipoprotein diacylglycerol transferase